MGGCQGCHGVAQVTLGTDFSFLLDNNGKPVLGPDTINSKAKLKGYIREIELAHLKLAKLKAKK